MESVGVDLTESELDLAERVAKERYQSNRESGVENQKVGPQSDYKTDLNGMVGELAFAKAYNVFPDIQIEPGSGGDDLTLKDGTRIDVKATEYLDGRLLAPLWKKQKDHADVFVLATIDWPDPGVQLRGWIRAENFLLQQNVINLGHGATFGVEQTELNSMDNL